MLNDPLSNAMSIIVNAEKVGKNSCIIRPASNMLMKILGIMKDRGYIGEFEKEEKIGGEVINVKLIGKINKCGGIKPRHSIKHPNIENAEQKYLPAKGFGFVVLTTPQGVLTNEEAKEKKTGGRLLAYCY